METTYAGLDYSLGRSNYDNAIRLRSRFGRRLKKHEWDSFYGIQRDTVEA